MDQKVCEAGKCLSALQYERKAREERLYKLESQLSSMRIINSTDVNEDREQVCIYHIYPKYWDILTTYCISLKI